MTILVVLRDVSIGACITAVLVMVARMLFGRVLSAKAKYYLWLLLALRLCLPVTPGSPTSLMNYIPRSGLVLDRSPAVEETMINNNSKEDPVNPMIIEPIQEAESVNATIDTPAATPLEIPSRSWSWSDIILIIWITGVAVVFFVYMILYALTERQMTSLPKCEDGETQRVFLRIKQQLRVSDRIILVSGNAGMLGGLFHPTLVLPVECRGEEATPILVHELMHYKYKDLWLYLLFRVLTAVYWFNPIVWLCFWWARQDSEKACDERALESGLVSSYTYAKTLYREGRLQSGLSLFPLTTFGGGHNIKGRMKNIARFRKRGKWVIVTAVVLALAITACGVTSVAKHESVLNSDISDNQEQSNNSEVSDGVEDIGAVIHALQPEYGRFGISYTAHVKAGYIDPTVTEKNIISPVCTEYTTSLIRDGEELEAVFVFSCTQFTQDTTERQVLTELYVEIPSSVTDERAWIDQQMESKDYLYYNNEPGLYYSHDTLESSLSQKEREFVAQRLVETGASETLDSAYNYIDNWRLSAVTCRPETQQVHFNGTGIALYMTRSDAFPEETSQDDSENSNQVPDGLQLVDHVDNEVIELGGVRYQFYMAAEPLMEPDYYQLSLPSDFSIGDIVGYETDNTYKWYYAKVEPLSGWLIRYMSLNGEDQFSGGELFKAESITEIPQWIEDARKAIMEKTGGYPGLEEGYTIIPNSESPFQSSYGVIYDYVSEEPIADSFVPEDGYSEIWSEGQIYDYAGDTLISLLDSYFGEKRERTTFGDQIVIFYSDGTLCTGVSFSYVVPSTGENSPYEFRITINRDRMDGGAETIVGQPNNELEGVPVWLGWYNKAETLMAAFECDGCYYYLCQNTSAEGSFLGVVQSILESNDRLREDQYSVSTETPSPSPEETTPESTPVATPVPTPEATPESTAEATPEPTQETAPETTTEIPPETSTDEPPPQIPDRGTPPWDMSDETDTGPSPIPDRGTPPWDVSD